MNARPHRPLAQALIGAVAALRIDESREEPWASATFEGARHIFSGWAPNGSEAALRRLAEHSFAIRGHLVADLSVDVSARANGLSVTIEALTLVDG